MMLSFMEIEIARVIQWQRENRVHLELDQKNSYGKTFSYENIAIYVLTVRVFLSYSELASELSQSRYLV